MADVTLNGNTYEGISEVEVPLADGSGMALYHEGAGIASVEQTVVSTEDDGNNEVTVTLTDGTEIKLYIQNGSRGSQGNTGNTGATGPKGDTGDRGSDGVGILGVEVKQDADTQARISIALTDGTVQDFPIYLPSGKNGVGVYSVEQTTTSTADGGSNVITVTLTDGEEYTFTVKNGSKGSDGADGATTAEVIAALTKETWTFTLADGTSVDKVVPLI